VRVLLALGLFWIPSVSLAQNAKRLELSGFVGGMSLSQSLGTTSNIYMTVTGAAEDVDFGKLFGFRASWVFTRNIAAEFNVSRAKTGYRLDVDDLEVGNVGLADQFQADQLLLGGGAIVQFPLRVGLVPYGSIGVGRLETKPASPIDGIESVSAIDVSFGGGVKYWVPSVPWLGVGFDLRYHTANDGLGFPGSEGSPSGTEFTVGGMVRLF
jgi:hypothetical protein